MPAVALCQRSWPPRAMAATSADPPGCSTLEDPLRMISVSKGVEFIDLTGSRVGGPAIRAFVVHEDAPASASDLAAAIEQIRPEREEVLVVAADHSVVTQIKRMAAVLARSDVQTARLIDAMFVSGSTVSLATTSQAQRNAVARQELIDEFGLYDSDQVADVAGSSASNRSATASRWLAAGKIFAVNHRGARLYPRFQFGMDGHPRPVIASVLEVFEPYGLDGWETALWFTTASGWLDDQRPVDLLTREPEQVVEAARHAFDEVVA
jgi:hypothetical protein